MGRKKSKRVVIKKKGVRPRLDTSFSCPFCNEEGSVECKVDRSKQTGFARCRSCQAGYQTVINYLSEPVDIFAEWVDAIDEQGKQRASRKAEHLKESRPTQRKNLDVDDSDQEGFKSNSEEEVEDGFSSSKIDANQRNYHNEGLLRQRDRRNDRSKSPKVVEETAQLSTETDDDKEEQLDDDDGINYDVGKAKNDRINNNRKVEKKARLIPQFSDDE